MKKLIGISPFGEHEISYWNYILSQIMDNYEIIVLENNVPVSLSVLDFLIFDGGSDVNPYYYGQFSKGSHSPDVSRDRFEYFLFRHYYHEPRTKYVGICRGHQFVNVMMLGSLFQDLPSLIRGHKPFHDNVVMSRKLIRYLTNIDEGTIPVNSTHHQAVNLIGPNMSVTMRHMGYGTVEGTESLDDKIRTVQSHPEYMDLKSYPNSIEVLKYLFRVEG
jgi:putative glutamine amidotransferase